MGGATSRHTGLGYQGGKSSRQAVDFDLPTSTKSSSNGKDCNDAESSSSLRRATEMLQLSHRARLGTQPGFICSSCRHLLSQPQRQQLQLTTCTTLPPSAAGVGIAPLPSSAIIPNQSSRCGRDLFRISRPFSTTNRRCENQKDETSVATADTHDEVPSKDTAGGEGEKGEPSMDATRSFPGFTEATRELIALMDETPPNLPQVDIAWKKVEDRYVEEIAHVDRKEAKLTVRRMQRLARRYRKMKNRVPGVEAQVVKALQDENEASRQGVEGEEKESNKESVNTSKSARRRRRKAASRQDQKQARILKLREKRQASQNEQSADTTKPPKKRGRKSTSNRLFEGVEPSSVSSSDLQLEPIKKKQPPVPRLWYGLNRVLFNPGVYHLQDPRTRVYNFDPYLARIMPIKEFDFGALKKFITSSQDTTLIAMAAEHGRKYTGSTSSMTAMLSHFHFLLSAWRPILPLMQSRFFEPTGKKMGRVLSTPSAAFLHYKDGVYAIDADKEFDTATILSQLGHSMEKLLTVSKKEFEKYNKRNSAHLSKKHKKSQDTYAYTALGDFLMRSQLDAYDPRLPGTGTFDLKTRAVASIRYLPRNIKPGLGYEIRNRFGQWESYEREYFDLIKNAFMKYSLQVRIGRMDGCFVAYHNTERIFGFHYIPLSEMDQAIHGTPNPALGDQEFKLSVHLLNQVLEKATKKYPKRSLRLHVETRPTNPPVMYIFAEPVTQEQIAKVQESNRKQMEEFEREMMGLQEEIEKAETAPSEIEDEADEVDVEGEPYRGDKTDVAAWEDMMDKVEEVLEDEEQGLTAIRESIESALLESGLIGDCDSKKSRRYIHALVEALTSDEDAKPATSKSQTSPSSTHAEPSVSSPAVTDDVEDPLDPESQASGMSGEIVVTDEASIKSLILRLASQLKAKHPAQKPQGSEQVAEQDVSEDTLRLQKFMGILSELVAKDQTPDELATEEKKAVVEEQKMDEKTPAEELIGMILTVKNKVNDEYVERPNGLHPAAKWEVEYVIEEMDDERAQTLYRQVRKRRRAVLGPDSGPMNTAFQKTLIKYARRGRRFRQTETRVARTQPVHVYGMNGGQPFTWSSVFDQPAFKSLSGKKLPIEHLTYKTLVPAGSKPGQKWEDTEARERWAKWMKTRAIHVPVFDITSAYWENDPDEEKQRVQYWEAQRQKSGLEGKIRALELKYGFNAEKAPAPRSREAVKEVEAGRKVREALETGGEMLGLSLNDLPPEEGEEEAEKEEDGKKVLSKDD